MKRLNRYISKIILFSLLLNLFLPYAESVETGFVSAQALSGVQALDEPINRFNAVSKKEIPLFPEYKSCENRTFDKSITDWLLPENSVAKKKNIADYSNRLLKIAISSILESNTNNSQAPPGLFSVSYITPHSFLLEYIVSLHRGDLPLNTYKILFFQKPDSAVKELGFLIYGV